MKTNSSVCLPAASRRLVRSLTVGLSLFASALSLSAQTLEVSGTLHAAVFRDDLDQLTGSPYIVSYPWQDVQTGAGMATQIEGFTSIADAISMEAERLTYSLNSLTLTSYTSGKPAGISTEIYTPTTGSEFRFYYDSATLAIGEVVSIQVFTDFTTGQATGSGLVRLTAPGGTTDFYDEIGTLSGGSYLMDFTISQFAAVNALGDFTSTGTFSVSAVPEPSAWAALFGGCALSLAVWRRRPATSVPARTA